MGADERIRQEKIIEYDMLYQQFFDKEISSPPVDQASADILKKQADALREQAELLDLAEDLIMVLDMEHRILFWNRGAEKKYGWRRSEGQGREYSFPAQHQFPAESEGNRKNPGNFWSVGRRAGPDTAGQQSDSGGKSVDPETQ